MSGLGNWVTYGLTGANRTSLVRKGQTGTTYYASGLTYSAAGAMAAATRGGFTESWTYNSRLQPRRLQVTGPASVNLLQLRWAYSDQYNPSTFEETGTNNSGNPRVEQLDYTAGAQTKAVTRTYGFDGTNRVSSFGDGSSSQTFGYDLFGNVWETSASGVPALSQTGASAYVGANNRLADVGHDAAGNRTGHGSWTLEYDAEGRMTRIKDRAAAVSGYDYDAEGRRVRKVVGAVTTYFVYGSDGGLLAEYGGSGGSGGLRQLVSDGLGSTRMVLDGAGACGERIDYAPFGAEMVRDPVAWPCYQGPGEVRQRFTGKERDSESATSAVPGGMDYFEARYYAGAWGRFGSPDRDNAGAEPSMPGSWNMFAYAYNNPMMYTDPTGLAGLCGVDPNSESGADRPFCLNQLLYEAFARVNSTNAATSSVICPRSISRRSNKSWWLPGPCRITAMPVK